MSSSISVVFGSIGYGSFVSLGTWSLFQGIWPSMLSFFFAGFSNLFLAFWLLMGVSKFGQIFLRYSNQVLLGLHVRIFFFR